MAPAPVHSRIAPSSHAIRLRNNPVKSRGDPTGESEKQHPAPVVRRLNSGTVADSVDDVTVVWGRHEGAIDETYVIGWFEHSTVFGQFLDRPDAERIAGEARTAGVEIEVGQEELQYFVTCKKEDARLLAVSERAFRVPIGKGWMARQSLLFYPDGGAEHEKLKRRLLDYITACTSSQTTSPVPYSAVVELLDGRSTVEGEQVLVTPCRTGARYWASSAGQGEIQEGSRPTLLRSVRVRFPSEVRLLGRGLHRSASCDAADRRPKAHQPRRSDDALRELPPYGASPDESEATKSDS